MSNNENRQPLIGFLLIGVIISAWMFWQSTQAPPPKPAQKTETKSVQSTQAQTPAQDPQQSQAQAQKALGALASLQNSTEELITVETDLATIQLTSKGASFHRWYLKQFKSWFGGETQLIPYNPPSGQALGEFGVVFTSTESKQVDTRLLNYRFDTQTPRTIKVSGEQTATVVARLPLPNGGSIVRTYTFQGNTYAVSAKVQLNNVGDIIANRRYELVWSNGVQYQESNSQDESTYAKAMMSLGGSIEEIDAAKFDEQPKTNMTGSLDYMAIKTKYFVASVIPQVKNSETAVYLEGQRIGAPNEGAYETYSMAVRLPYRGQSQEDAFTVYVGPIDYDILKQYNMQAVVDFGWKWIIRPIGEWFMLPVFQATYKVIPNYGLAILLFTLLMKVLMHPLSIGQLQSSMKMQLLAPEIEKIRKRHPDDMQTQQQETMKLYGEYGINPAGGCLPLLLQMPILYALWAVLSSAIQLRQMPFVGWITDLATPDVLYRLPFKVPLFNVDIISGLAIAMGLTMFVQQKLTITDPRQKAMVYMIPVMMTLSFSNFPAGLNLYYFLFNLLGIAQQLYLTKFSKNKLTLADLKRMPKKEGWFAKKMREAQEIATSQGRELPGQSSQKSSSKKKK
jgi:YidC/Oxa1 family membrane protein insertase